MKTEQRQIGRELLRMNNVIRRHLCKNKGGCMPGDEVTSTNLRIIRFLKANENRDIYQKDVEKEFGITRSTASRVLVLMEEKGLVKRMSVEQDARLKKLVLTEKSSMLGEKMRIVGEQTDVKLFQGFSDEEKEQLFSFIDRMVENMTGEECK